MYFGRKKEDGDVGSLEISGYHYLKKIVIKKNTLRNLDFVKICDNKQLKSIEIEDGERWEENGKWFSNGSFYNVKNVNIESK